MTSLIVHGHFYQPPRENPWTGAVDEEPSARPFKNWNERVNAECYGPNTAVRVIDKNSGRERFINNYTNVSFDFGPTLLSWLAQHDPQTYRQILAADAESVIRRGGHGNAIAQAYAHPILPLCTEHDRRTQVRWGLADFRHRFGRDAEAMWLPETACNDEVLDLLIDEGLRFVILAPHQAVRVRQRLDTSLGGEQAGAGSTGEWETVADGTIDTSVPYAYFHRDGSNRSIAIYFYDQKLAGAIAFEHALSSSKVLVDRFARAVGGTGSFINVATDGESYGHHHKFGDVCLAYALEFEAPSRDISVTNYGEYLDRHPPEREVEINNGELGEGTSWSCIHGVSRWTTDCGCSAGAEPGWNQSWRGPLREALDYLRDETARQFESAGGEIFRDPWGARDAAIELILDPKKSRESFFHYQARRLLSQDEQRKALLMLEAQRNALLMYASCGWFFNDIAGIEPVQILKYACRVIDLTDQLGLPSPRERFLEILSRAESNRPEMGNGAEVYRRMVEPLKPAAEAVKQLA